MEINVKLEESYLQKVSHFFYSIFKDYYEFPIFQGSVYYTYNSNRVFIKKESFDITLYDSGIYISLFSIFIPYEYILYVEQQNKNFIFYIMGKLHNNSIELCDSSLKLEFKIKECVNLLNLLKSNIYYHIKYNNVNNSVLNFKNYKKNFKSLN